MNTSSTTDNLKAVQPPPPKPEVEPDEVPTMILDGEQFFTYRRFRMMNGSAPQPKPPAIHLLPAR